MASNVSTPKGTRDFSPEEMTRRNYIFNTIRSVFAIYGFLPIETPSMENLSTLMGKYGEEGDKLLFKVLNSGDFMKGVTPELLESSNNSRLTTKISEKGLRYDLTVPFARYVVQHRNDITFPFKRYQIQPVWRADRPQKGRYREFYQCDVDVIGSNSLLNEVELIQIIDDVFKKLNINTVIKINNRKILLGIAEYIGYPDKLIDITVAIDKIDKIGLEKVNDELISKGIPSEAIGKLRPIITLEGTTKEKISILRNLISESAVGINGIEEIESVLRYLEASTMNTIVELDLSLARGLNYYTGAIFEVKALDVQMGSICGGGRYDDLTGIFGLKNVSGVGVSFGADRIYDVLNEINLFPENTNIHTRVLFTNFGNKEEAFCLSLLSKLRKENIPSEIYPEQEKLKKQMAYADGKHIPYVALVGDNEMAENLITVKNMKTGEQLKMTIDELINIAKNI